jgi:hypothetical protein
LTSRRPSDCSADQPARGGRDHHGAGVGQGLQSRRQVRRLPDHRLLLRGAFADQFADHDEAGGDPDANLQLADGWHVEPSDRGNDVEAGAHGPLGIVFVSARMAEIDEHAVAHVFGDETIEAANRFGDRGGIGEGRWSLILSSRGLRHV